MSDHEWILGNPMKFDCWWWIVMNVGGWPYYKWYHSFSNNILQFLFKEHFSTSKSVKARVI